MSEYPGIFNKKCMSKQDIKCNSHDLCNLNINTVGSDKNIINIDKTDRNGLSPFNNNTKCGYKSPSLEYVVSDNNVINIPRSSHSWSNQRGYGNIVVGSFDTCSNIYSKVHPYNRIPPLSIPTETNVDTNMAWNVNKVKVNRK